MVLVKAISKAVLDFIVYVTHYIGSKRLGLMARNIDYSKKILPWDWDWPAHVVVPEYGRPAHLLTELVGVVQVDDHLGGGQHMGQHVLNYFLLIWMWIIFDDVTPLHRHTSTGLLCRSTVRRTQCWWEAGSCCRRPYTEHQMGSSHCKARCLDIHIIYYYNYI